MKKQILVILTVLLILPIAIAMKEPTMKIGGGEGSSETDGGLIVEPKQICDPELEICNPVETPIQSSSHHHHLDCDELHYNVEIQYSKCFEFKGITYKIKTLNFIGYKVLQLFGNDKWLGSTGIEENARRFLMNDHLQIRLENNKVYLLMI